MSASLPRLRLCQTPIYKASGMDRLFKRSHKAWEGVLGGVRCVGRAKMEILAIAEQGVGLHLGRTKPAEHPRLVLKGSHSSNWVANSVPAPYLHSKGARQQGYDNKPGSHSDYAHHGAIPSFLTRNACPQVITLIQCGAGHFNEDVPHNVLQIAS